MTRYLVLAAQPWAQRIAWPVVAGDVWVIVTDPESLGRERNALGMYPPEARERAFVLHWHWRIPAEMIGGKYLSGGTELEPPCEFIGFHASDLPHFRGGDPIGNQQARGITETKLTAFRLVEALDAGPILLQEPLSLAGTKADVLARIAGLVPGMIRRIIAGEYAEREQGPGGSFYTRADVGRAR